MRAHVKMNNAAMYGFQPYDTYMKGYYKAMESLNPPPALEVSPMTAQPSARHEILNKDGLNPDKPKQRPVDPYEQYRRNYYKANNLVFSMYSKRG